MKVDYSGGGASLPTLPTDKSGFGVKFDTGMYKRTQTALGYLCAYAAKWPVCVEMCVCVCVCV
jgi:hypothetical protein